MSARPTITVAITRFEDLLALGLEAALEADRSLAIVARDVAPEHVRSMLRGHHPRVLILDVGSLRDYSEVREITTEHPETRLVLLGHGISSVESAQLLAFGASACLSVSSQVRDLRHAIHLASRGLQLQLLPTNRDIQDTEPLLTPREGDVLSLLRENRSNAQIALGLGIGVETVRSHARNIYRKLGVSSRRTLLAVAQGGSVPAPPVEPPVPAPPVEPPVLAPLVEAPVPAPPVEPLVLAPPVEAPVPPPLVEAPVPAPPVEAPPVEPVTYLARTRSVSLSERRRPKQRRSEHH